VKDGDFNQRKMKVKEWGRRSDKVVEEYEEERKKESGSGWMRQGFYMMETGRSFSGTR